MHLEYVFIDNGGVITDNRRRAEQFQRLVGRGFAERFGGKQDVWSQANTGIVADIWGRFLHRVENWDTSRDIRHEKSLYFEDWLQTMFAKAGVPVPVPAAKRAVVAKEIEDWINPQIDAHYPGVDGALATLGARFRLFAASDGFSDALAVALGANAATFERLYGPELVNVPKSSGRPYYDAIFADARVDPTRALVIDDGVANLLAARETGARTVLVSAQ